MNNHFDKPNSSNDSIKGQNTSTIHDPTEVRESLESTMLVELVSPFILILGLFGNTLAFFVMYQMRGLLRSFVYYFMALSLADNTTLVFSLFPRWLFVISSSRMGRKADWLCLINAFIHNSSCYASSWFLAALVSQRAAGTVWPHAKSGHKFRGVSTAVIVISVIAVLSVVLQFHFFLESDAIHKNCAWGKPLLQRFTRTSLDWAWINFTIVFAAPFLVILSSNTVLLITLRTSANRLMAVGSPSSTRRTSLFSNSSGRGHESQRQGSIKDSVEVNASPSRPPETSQSILGSSLRKISIRLSRRQRRRTLSMRRKRERSVAVTFTIIAASVFFCVLLVPSYLTQALLVGEGSGYTVPPDVYIAIVELMEYSNSAVNFYLYCLTGTLYRRKTRHILKRMCPTLCRLADLVNKKLFNRNSPQRSHVSTEFTKHGQKRCRVQPTGNSSFLPSQRSPERTSKDIQPKTSVSNPPDSGTTFMAVVSFRPSASVATSDANSGVTDDIQSLVPDA